MRFMLACILIAVTFAAADAAYGLGGGGHHGDGRWAFPQQTGDDCAINGAREEPTFAVPEPIAVLLLGLGVVGLTGAGRKYRSHK